MRLIGNVEKDAQVRAVASGALSSGEAVVVNSDGTVSVVAGAAEGIGTPNVFGSGGTTREISSTYDPVNNKFVVFYRDNGQSGHGYAVVGSVSGSSIAFGSPVEFLNANLGSTKCTYDVASGKVVVFFQDAGNSNYGTARVGTISGTSISFGTAVVFQSSQTTYIYPQYEANQQRTVVAYTDSTDSNQGFVKSGQVSGTSISFGSRANYSTSGTYDKALIYDSSQQKMLLFYGSFNGFTARSRVVTVSGSSVSFGSEVLVTSGTAQEVDGYYDTSINKPVIIWKDSGNSDYGTGIVATISGTSVSFGTKYVFNSANTTYLAAAYDSTNNVGLIAYGGGFSSNNVVVTNVTATGTALAYSTPFVTSEYLANKQIDIIYDDNAEKSVITSINNSTDEFGQSFTYAAGSTNLTSENFLGFADSGYANGKSAAINSTCTVDRNQSGLTAGQTYYVQTDGSLGTTAADPSVVAGTAISSTEIIVKG
jgi:hypothetical protein